MRRRPHHRRRGLLHRLPGREPLRRRPVRGGETPQSCPTDCAGDCVPETMRCQGVAIESCNLRGRWEAIACPQGEACVQRAEDPAPRCARDDVVVGQDGGVADAAGPRIAGRLLLGDADYAGTGTAVRPGSGRDLTLRDRFGYLRACQGNAAEQARCREEVSAHLRDELVNHVMRSEIIASVPAGAEEVWLWGTHAVMAFSFAGDAPDSGPLPDFETFCAAWSARCAGSPDACVDEAARGAYAAWTDGAQAMTCWLAEEGCEPSDACRRGHRQRGYDDALVVPRPDQLHLSDDGTLAALWTDEQHVAVYDVATRTLTPVGDVGAYSAAGGTSLAFSADGRFVAATAVSGQTFDSDGLLVVWAREGGPPVAAVPLPDVAPVAVALSPDGRLAAVTRRKPPGNPALYPEGIDVIDVASSSLLFRILPAEEPDPQGLRCGGFSNGGLAFSPQGDRLAAGAQHLGGLACTPSPVVEVWNLATREKEVTLTGPPRLGVEQLRYSPDGTTLAVASRLFQAPPTSSSTSPSGTPRPAP
ncbi:MAG: WD40 repeat domain-containing protein [bacterium]